MQTFGTKQLITVYKDAFDAPFEPVYKVFVICS